MIFSLKKKKKRVRGKERATDWRGSQKSRQLLQPQRLEWIRLYGTTMRTLTLSMDDCQGIIKACNDIHAFDDAKFYNCDKITCSY